MDDVTFGRVVRMSRIRRRKRQVDLAKEARLSPATVGRVERGSLDGVSLRVLRRIGTKLDLRVDLRVTARGATVDRLLSARHARLAEAVVRWFRLERPQWVLLPERSFSVWGERGVVDLVAWHPSRRMLLIVELKTEIVDVGAMLATLDRKRRLGAAIVADLDWQPKHVGTWLIVAGGRTNERRMAEHRATLRAAYPDGGRRARAWLREPEGPIAAMSGWQAGPRGNEVAAITRVRR